MLSQNRRIGVGLIGCGRISPKHLEAIKNLPELANLVGVYDTNESRTREAADTFGCKQYKSYEEILSDPNINLVSLCTPSGLHPEHGISAAKAKKHVLTEKPMAVHWEDGVQLVEGCRKANVELFVVKQNRLNPTIRILKNAIAEGRLGRIHTVTSNVLWYRPQEYYDQAPWRGTWDLDGGAFMNQASHYVDLMTYLGGPVKEVSAFIATQTRKIETEDSGVANFKYTNGALGTMTVTMLTYPKNMEGSVTVLGDSGSVRVGGVALNKFEFFELAGQRPDEKDLNKLNYEPSSVYGNGHLPFYENVFKSLLGVSKPLVDGFEGLESLQTLVSIYRSAKQGQSVSLPLEGWPQKEGGSVCANI